MRVRTGHGPDDWTPSVPASTGSSRLGGELVVGDHGSVEMGRIKSRVHKDRARGVPMPRQVPPQCEPAGRCRHKACTSARAIRARHLYATTGMTLRQIGAEFGGRDHSTVIYWLRDLAL